MENIKEVKEAVNMDVAGNESGTVIKESADTGSTNTLDLASGNILLQQENTSDEIERFLYPAYDFKFNIVTGKVFFKRKEDNEFSELNDYAINSIIRHMKREDMKCSVARLIGILYSDFVAKYDPFKQYLDNLQDWNNETDHIAEWAVTIQTTNQDLWHKCFKKWIVALAGSLYSDKTINHTAIIFCGPQGIGKTSWIGKLVPDSLKEYFFSGTINMSNKDSLTQLSECMIIDMDELENLSKKSIGDLKGLMTRSTIRVRRPYGRMAETLPRRASFIGSINHKEFLKDETGSRRFLCFEMKEMNHNHNLNIDLLYQQALFLYKSGFEFWFNQDEILEIQRSNKQFERTFLESELLVKNFKPCKIDDATHFLTATEVTGILKIREGTGVNSASVQRVGKALAVNKFERVKKYGKYCWAVFDKNDSRRKKRKVIPRKFKAISDGA